MHGARYGTGQGRSLAHYSFVPSSSMVLFTAAGEALTNLRVRLVILTLNHPLTSLGDELVNCGQGLWFALK